MYRLSRSASKLAVIVGLSLALIGFALKPASADVAINIAGAANCDANAVVYCGAGTASQLVAKYNGGDGRNTAASIHNIYSYFGISSAMVQAMPTTAVVGSVTSGGAVIVGGKTVATSALTGGRQNISGSTLVNSGGTSFYVRPPSVSFVSSSLPAYVVMSGGRFQFAVIASCGNAVKATPVAPPPAPAPKPVPVTPAPKPAPPSTPNYTIQKLVAPNGSNNFQPEITVQPNTDVDYQVTIKSTGNAAVQNLNVSDTLPNDDTYVTGSLKRDGANIDAQSSQFFGGGLAVSSLAAGSSTTFTFEALVGANQNNANCNPETLPNVSHMTATNLPPESATATVSLECAPAPAKPAVLTSTSPPAAPPTQLVNTGPGEVVGLFAAASAAGALGYRLYLGRKLGR